MEYTAEIISTDKFRVKRKSISGSFLFFSRLLWSYYPTGGRAWMQGVFIALQVIFTFAVLPLDVVFSLLHFGLKLLLEVLKIILKGFLILWKVFSEKALGTTFKWIVLIAVTILIYTIIKDGLWINLYQQLSDWLRFLDWLQ